MIGCFKEYFNLSNFYLKINLTQEGISLTSYDNKALDGDIYQVFISSQEIMENKKYQNIDVKQLYEKIINLIELNKFLLSKEKNCLVLSLIEGEYFDISKDFQFILIKSIVKKVEYENAKKKLTISLRQKNPNMKENNEQLNLDLTKKSESAEFLSYPGKPKKQEENTTNVTVQPNQPNPFIKNGNEPIQKIDIDKNNQKKKKNITSSLKVKRQDTLGLTINTLANINYGSYPNVELSSDSYDLIAGFGGNSYNGTIRKSNEDKIKIIAKYKLSKEVKKKNGEIINPNISYFAIYDGHGGNKCSIFLQQNLHEYIFSSEYFPLYTMQAIKSAYLQAEKNFFSMATDSETGKLLDKSGSCAVSVLILDEWCFVINLGDSRGLYSFNSGKRLYQITRDHKPNDPIEKERIEKAGGKIYKDDEVIFRGEKMKIDEKNLPPGVVLPYRVIPGNISVRKIYFYYFNFNIFIGNKNYRRFPSKRRIFWRKSKYYYMSTLY